MKKLVERWRVLEPDRCLIGPPTSHHGAGFRLGKDVHFVQFDYYPAQQLALLLAAVIEAIEARGWVWSLERTNYGGGSWMAGVGPESAADWAGEDSSTESPVAALLAAYVAALEAEAAQ